ncbi:MAG TPA: hypothetical protein VJ889_27155 [Pseudomonas sp.]|nr:hypothetical protein [Pseudomonas sp.]
MNDITNDITLASQLHKGGSGRPRHQFVPVILSATTPSGDSVPNGGSTTERSLYVVGVGLANTQVKIYNGPRYLRTVNVDYRSHWSIDVDDLQIGFHAFSAVNDENEHSPLWITNVEENVTVPKIVKVTDSKGQEIENGGTTQDSTLRFFGAADPRYGVAELFDRGDFKTIIPLEESGDWQAQLDGVQDGVHKYEVVTPGGESSPPWTVVVVNRARPA